MTKRRFRDRTSGAIFVPNVDEVTIQQKVVAGEWTEVVDTPAAPPPPPKQPRRRSAPANRNRD